MEKPEKIFIANDHAGFSLKSFLIQHNPHQNWEDLGVFNEEDSHYPEQAELLCTRLLKNNTPNDMDTVDESAFGVLICGSGQGMVMKANRFSGIRAALTWNEESSRLAREHNKANVLCLGARLLDFETADKLFKVFIHTPFKAGRHLQRIKKLR